MPLLSLRAYAKHRGVSLAAVQKAIQSGRITPDADGRIDSERADAEWGAKTRPGQRRARPAPATRQEPAEAPATGIDYFRARAIRESYLARLAKIEFEEKTGKLVSRDEVQVAGFTLGRTIRDHMMIIPDRVAAQIRSDLAGALTAACRDLSLPLEIAEAALAKIDLDHIHGVLSNEIRTVLVEVAGLPDHGG
ncbi:MAG: hypothetical protein IT158_15970 [Bryobacterales bacterium]|nr:hypothetical protein [Bryobacterales bacterium]